MADSRFVERVIQPLLATQTISAPVTTDFMKANGLAAAGFMFIYGSGLSAAFDIQASLDGTNWASMNAVITPAAGTAGTSYGVVDASSANYVRAVITPTSGSGTMLVQGKWVAKS